MNNYKFFGKTLFLLPFILLLTNCSHKSSSLIPSTSSPESDPVTLPVSLSKNERENSRAEEVVVFFGNVGVGKSSLCNSIFQKSVFGISLNKEMTLESQAYIHENRKYIDTPGLSNSNDTKQAVAEIEKALKENNNYKIIFVAMLDYGKIRHADLLTINRVCASIKVPFEYGIIFNKVTKGEMSYLTQRGLDLRKLNKKPFATVVLEKEAYMEAGKNVFFPINSPNRDKMLSLISKLSGFKKVDVVDVQEREKAQLYKDEVRDKIISKQLLHKDITDYFLKHTTSKNINWSKMTLPKTFYTKPALQQAQIVAAMYKDLLYSKTEPKHGGWLLLARRCYQWNQFKGHLLSPEEMGLRRIEPKYFMDPDYNQQLIRYVRDGTLKLTSIKGGRVNPFIAKITIVNKSNEDIKFKFTKGQILEQDAFRDVQNLAITGIIKTVEDEDGNILKLENSFKAIEGEEGTVKANSQLEVTVQCRCINPTSGIPNNEYMNETDFIDVQVNQEPDEAENPCSKYADMPDLGSFIELKK